MKTEKCVGRLYVRKRVRQLSLEIHFLTMASKAGFTDKQRFLVNIEGGKIVATPM